MDEAAHILEPTVHRGKADVSDLVQGLDTLHYHLTDGIGGDFPLQSVLNGLFNFGSNAIQIFHSYLPLIKGADHGVKDLVPVKGLMRAVPFYNDNRQAFYNFLGGEPAQALQTLPASADTLTVLGVTGVHDLAVLISAKWTFHKKRPPFWFVSENGIHNTSNSIIPTVFDDVQLFF